MFVTADAGSSAVEAILWMAGLLLLLGISAAGWRFWRRRSSAKSENEGFTLDSLKQLRDAGKLTEHEYQALRARVIDEMRAGLQESDGRPGL